MSANEDYCEIPIKVPIQVMDRFRKAADVANMPVEDFFYGYVARCLKADSVEKDVPEKNRDESKKEVA